MDIQALQARWGAGIVEIGEASTWEEAKDRAARFIKAHYALDGTLLFFPTKAAQRPFRPEMQGILSYFVGRDSDFPEDKGFALQPWTAVRFENEGIVEREGMTVAMGHYFFTDTAGGETKVEYTFGYGTTADGEARILVHHSALPFQG